MSYFRCPECSRWVSTSYAESFRGNGQVQVRERGAAAPAAGFDQIKARLERWLAALENDDPYRTLGASPRSSREELRERYRALAFENHPDRGGCAERMQRINQAYERVEKARSR